MTVGKISGSNFILLRPVEECTGGVLIHLRGYLFMLFLFAL